MYLLPCNFIFGLLARLHLFNDCYYRTFSNNAQGYYFKISLRSGYSKIYRKYNSKNIAILKHFGTPNLSI